MWGFHHYWDGFGWLWGTVMDVFFWVLIICGILSLIQGGTKNSECKKKETPLDILKKRYASGEINAEEFAKIKKDLES